MPGSRAVNWRIIGPTLVFNPIDPSGVTFRILLRQMPDTGGAVRAVRTSETSQLYEALQANERT